jgi:transcriptional regulator with XRE-family HTH domain
VAVPKRKRPTDTSQAGTKRSSIDLARRVRRSRDAAGLTQEAVARRAHLTAKFISEIENGHVNPSIEVVARLVEQGLELPLSAFFAVDIGDTRSDIERIVALLGGQPAATRRRVLRVVQALLDE